ncbi:MAG TPA: type 4a pilus biogenesis protein PilO [Gammaproteobacteria bacterium]|nr:type 4a pilus biogenesis protein PilO [Gammaproteobacteria bacterium]
MKNIKLDELELDNIAAWPLPVRFVVIVMGCILVLFLGYWFDTKAQRLDLARIEQEERELKTAFETKYHQAANVEAYKQQLKIMKASFGALLRQLPESTEVPGLLEDISHQGLAAGLEFRSIRLQPEKEIDFYVELPIEISVVGTYHQFSEFVSNVSALPRIVTLHDFVIDLADPASKGKEPGENGESLTMNITAKTYRYTANEEAH